MYLDTRDLYTRQNDLQDELATLEEELRDAEERQADDPDEGLTSEIEDAREALQDWKDEYLEELEALDQLETEIGSEWRHGETLIPEDEFEDYARELAEDLHGSEMRNTSWPFDCIDWEQAADALRMDYSTVEFQGETYLFRE